MEAIGLVLVGLAILVGLLGVIVPVLPGLLLVWGAVLVWAVVERTTLAWAVLGVATTLVAVGEVVKYLIPSRRMRAAGVPVTSLAAGGVLAIVGFFVIPVVGGPIGFVLGVYLAERARLPGHAEAWPSTLHAIKAAGLSIMIELGAGLLVAGTWLGAVIFG